MPTGPVDPHTGPAVHREAPTDAAGTDDPAGRHDPDCPDDDGPLLAGGNVIDLALRRGRPVGPHDWVPEPAYEPEDPGTAAARLAGVTHAPGTSTADPGLVAAIRRVNRRLSEPEVTTLAEAILAGQAVRIRYRSASSRVTDRVVSELELSGNLLAGWCHLREDDRVFSVSEILSVGHP